MTQLTMQDVDKSDTIKKAQAMRVRNAYLELLRAWCDMHDLPQPVPTKVERGEALPKTEHHNR